MIYDLDTMLTYALNEIVMAPPWARLLSHLTHINIYALSVQSNE